MTHTNTKCSHDRPKLFTGRLVEPPIYGSHICMDGGGRGLFLFSIHMFIDLKTNLCAHKIYDFQLHFIGIPENIQDDNKLDKYLGHL